MLKRKLDETVNAGGEPGNATTSNGQSESDDSNCSAGSTDALAPEVASGPSPPKRMKKKVNFKGVTVFYFPRRQGFTCVPSEGGSTLGMSEKHNLTRDFTLSDYTKEQKRIHRAILAEQRRQGKLFPSPLLASSQPPLNTDPDVSSGSDSESEYDDYYFLQPLPIRQRRVLLRTAGVKKIDNDEKDECRDIRVSRNVCGCDCKLFCDPATCSCSLAGIQCQVDRLSFPCGCTRDGCSNPAGRIEFNPIRVRTHFIHTLMRLELERKDTECSQGNSAAATTSYFSQTASATSGEIDVVGAIGEEGEVVSPETTDGGSEDSCSGASTDAVVAGGMKVLRSRLKAKKAEAIDLNMFNSNERGSCRDCQNTDMCNVMMHDVKFSMVAQHHHHQHQQRVVATTLGPQPGYPLGPQMQHHHHLGLSPSISLLHPPPPLVPPPQQQQQSTQHMLLFNDGEEEEVYRAENTACVYFDIDDNSYCEMSDTPSDVLDNRPFSSLTQPGFSGKFQASHSQMFAAAGISTPSKSSNAGVHSPIPGMSSQTSLLTPSCIHSMQVNGLQDGASPSCSSMGQQLPCGMMTHPHVQHIPTTAAPSHSLFRPPVQLSDAHALTSGHCMPPESTMTSGHCMRPEGARISSVGHCVQPEVVMPSSSGYCVQPEGAMASSSALSAQSGFMACMENSLKQGISSNSNNIMFQGTEPNCHSTFNHTEMENAVHAAPSVYKLESSVLSDQPYSSSNPPVTSADYLSHPPHCNSFATQAGVGTGNLATTDVSSNGSTGFKALQPVQHLSCWNTSLTRPNPRDCFDLGATPSVAIPSASQQTPPEDVSIGPIYEQELESRAVTLTLTTPSPSIATTYATMTTTTHDLLAEHCPGISSHVDSRPDPSTSIARNSTSPSYSSFKGASIRSEISGLERTHQNLFYSMPDSGSNNMEPHINLSLTCVTGDSSLDSRSDNFLTKSPSSTSLAVSSSSSITSLTLTSELLNTSSIYSHEASSTSMPSSLHPSLNTSASTTSLSENCQPEVASKTPFSHLSASATQVSGSIEHTLQDFSKENSSSQTELSPNEHTSSAEARKDRQDTIESGELPKLPSEHHFVAEAHLDIENTKSVLKEHECSWRQEHLKDLDSDKITGIMQGEQNSDQGRKPADSGIVSSLPPLSIMPATKSSSSTASAMASSSTVPTSTASSSIASSSPEVFSDGDIEKSMSQDFGDIMKESIIEMVVV